LAQFFRTLVNGFSSAKRQNQSLGVAVNSTGVALAQICRPAKQQPQLTLCEFFPNNTDQKEDEISQYHHLKKRFTQLNVMNDDCNWLMAANQYQLILGEAPKVPNEELTEALRWKIKDLVTFPIADAIVDSFLLPEDSARGTNRMAYAVVTQRKNIEALVATAKAACVQLKTIDIPEFALRNLAEVCSDTRRGVALVCIQQGGGSLQIIRDGNLYLSRQFSLSYNAGLLDELPADALILELQRSLDYFERQMRQNPPSHIYLCGEYITPDKLTQTIRNAFSVPIDLLDINRGLQLINTLPTDNLSLCLQAVGAALRQNTLGQV
jgi:MSHA biogenesis protein MshI